jgi:hypothetical protein
MKLVLLALALTFGLLVVGGATATQAADDVDNDGPAIVSVAPQTDDVSADDTRVWVQGWTVLAVVGAACVGLVAMMVRVVMGWVKPPPELDDPH